MSKDAVAALQAAIDALDTGLRSGPNPADIDTTRYTLKIED